MSLVAVAAGLSAAALQGSVAVRLERAEIQVGESVVVHITAAAGSTVAVAAAGASIVTPATVSGTGAAQAVTLGPFTQPGAFTITATSGSGAARRQAVATLQVTWAGSGPAVTGVRVGPATARAADALVEAINASRTSVTRLPASEPTIAEAKAAIDVLLQQLADIRRKATEAAATIDGYGALIEQESNATREAKDRFSQLAREINQVLDQQAQQIAAFGRDAGAAPEEPCAAAMTIAAALDGSRATVRAMQGAIRQFGREHGGSGDGAAWARTHVTAGRPLRGEGTPQSSEANWRQMKSKIETLVATGQASSFSEAERAVTRATGEQGLGGYATRQCVKYTGEMSGSTHVEALDKGQAFYGLRNNWTARIELAAARTVRPGADAPVRGVIRGEATDFKVQNLLRSLYAGRPAQLIEYLQSDPPPEQQSGALFVAAVEGSIRGNEMTLKIRPGGVDYAGRVTGKIAAVVIPHGSPVPLVQTYDLPFQGGNWQLMRAIGPDGVTERPLRITVSGDKRLVEAAYPRTLSATGARGNFTIKLKLCHGCD
ncbi:MAG: hypothetical protein M3Q55_01550 [Acidobacteriota bacterium]|nr:hypothetical protein [Acidobacteriota bacterium]